MPLIRAAVIAVVALMTAPAIAQTPERARAAREHLEAATAAFDAGDYPRALAEVAASQRLQVTPEAGLLGARALQRVGRIEDAIAVCERVAVVAPPAMQPSLQDLLDSLRRQRSLAHAPPVVEPAAQPATPAPPRRSRRWVWAVVVPIAAAVALGVGLGFGLTRDSTPSTQLGVVHFNPP